MTKKTHDTSETDARLMAFLRGDSLVANAVLDELVAIQRAAWKPFGRVAVELGFLKIVHVAKVLSHQATHPGRTFGQVACDLGLLRTEQVSTILERQQSLVPSIAELLVAEMVLEPGELADALHSAIDQSSPATDSGTPLKP